MQLARALLNSHTARRESWPEGVFISTHSEHRIGSTPVAVVDIESDEAEPPSVYRHFTLIGSDPKSRVYERKELAGGAYIPQHDCVRFKVPDWHPSIDDLFATDWTPL
jgi:hypothetical protein